MARGFRNQQSGEEKVKVTKRDFFEALKSFQYIKPYKWQFILGMVFLVLSSLVFLVVMKIPGEVLNILSGKPQYGYSIGELFIILFAILIIQSLISFIRVWLFAIVSERSIADMRRDVFGRILSLNITFFDNHRTGELTSRISNDVNQLQNVISIVIAEFLRQIVLLLGAILVICIKLPQLALIMVSTFLPIVLIALFFGKYIRKIMKKRQDELAKSNVIVEESIQSVQSVKAYTNERFEYNRYVNSLKDVVKVSLQAGIARGLMASFIILALFGSLFFVMWRASLMVQSGNMNIGDLNDFILYTIIIGGAVASLGSFYPEVMSAVGATQRIRDILKIEPEIKVSQALPQTFKRFNGDIQFDDVHFTYPTRPEMQILKGINLEIAAGKTIALVGASGAGKSTIMQLILRFYNVESGSIKVDGQNIQDYDISEYRRNIAIVPQEVLLFGGSIGENIAYGKPDATEQEIIAAAQKANAWDFISSFPEGLKTLVGERGVKLSGGQRQRIAIARAILKDPSILLLDEATSSLDAESEKIVQDALYKLMKGRTSIIIAHRLSTIREADYIFVMDGGRVVEAGTHEELIGYDNGVYNNLLKIQYQV